MKSLSLFMLLASIPAQANLVCFIHRGDLDKPVVTGNWASRRSIQDLEVIRTEGRGSSAICPSRGRLNSVPGGIILGSDQLGNYYKYAYELSDTGCSGVIALEPNGLRNGGKFDAEILVYNPKDDSLEAEVKLDCTNQSGEASTF